MKLSDPSLTFGLPVLSEPVADSGRASGTTTYTWMIADGVNPRNCHMDYVKTAEWPGRFTANATITNTGTSAISGWTVGFAFPGDQKITNAWNATTGHAVTTTNASCNSSIAPGANTPFGFQGTYGAAYPG